MQFQPPHTRPTVNTKSWGGRGADRRRAQRKADRESLSNTKVPGTVKGHMLWKPRESSFPGWKRRSSKRLEESQGVGRLWTKQSGDKGSTESWLRVVLAPQNRHRLYKGRRQEGLARRSVITTIHMSPNIPPHLPTATCDGRNQGDENTSTGRELPHVQ